MKEYILLGALSFLSLRFATSTSAQNAGLHIDPSADFMTAAEQVVGQVVHVKSFIKNEDLPLGQRLNLGSLLGEEFMEEFYGPQPRQPKSEGDERQATGSGVVIRENGYIITNRHVVDKASRVEVVLYDNRSFTAKIVGTDIATDLAVLKIEATALSAMKIANSDSVRLGQWVLAAGNPFNLNSTITAGIVSAKARNIGISKSSYAVESFIQTDAAINPGNSGGALVNLKGELIGINTAIATPTGAYAGYGFAVPSNLVRKVMEDLINYGIVKRGFLGVSIRDVDASFAQSLHLTINEGVFVDSLVGNGGAQKAGIQRGDVIVSIDSIQTKNTARLQELVSRHKPGDVVVVSVNRFGQIVNFKVTLVNHQGDLATIGKGAAELLQLLGVEAETVSDEECVRQGIGGGVKILKIHDGIVKQQTEMKEGFIVTKIDNQTVSSASDFISIMNKKDGGVLLEGKYGNTDKRVYYGFGLSQ